MKLFEKFFALPRFRFDLPTRRDGESLDTLAGIYAERYVQTIAPEDRERSASLTSNTPRLAAQSGTIRRVTDGASGDTGSAIGVQRSLESGALDPEIATRIARRAIDDFSRELEVPPAGVSPATDDAGMAPSTRPRCCVPCCNAGDRS